MTTIAQTPAAGITPEASDHVCETFFLHVHVNDPVDAAATTSGGLNTSDRPRQIARQPVPDSSYSTGAAGRFKQTCAARSIVWFQKQSVPGIDGRIGHECDCFRFQSG